MRNHPKSKKIVKEQNLHELRQRLMLPKISLGGWFGYLLGTVSDDIGQFLHNEVNALDAGLFETGDLLLDDGLEGHVRGEETDSHT